MDLIVDVDSEDKESHIEETAFKRHEINLQQKFESGTVEITEELAKQAVAAFTSRMEAVENYAKRIVEKINDAYKQYEDGKGSDNKSQTNQAQAETYLAVEEWIDDIFLTYSEMYEHLELRDDGYTLDQFIEMNLPVSEEELPGGFKQFQSLARQMNDLDKKNTDMYYFQKRELLKKFVQNMVNKSKLKLNLEDFARQGILSGMFISKERYKTDEESPALRLTRDEPDINGYHAIGEVEIEVKREGVVLFEVPDIRNLRFPKERMDWVCERNYRNFSDIAGMTFDDNGKPLENAAYDPKQINKLAKLLKEQISSPREKNPDTDFETYASNITSEEAEFDFSELWKIDQQLILWEAHYIPMQLKQKGKAKVVKSLMVFVELASGKYMPIQIQPSPYYRLPYIYRNFVPKRGDIVGRGLPEITKEIQDNISQILSFCLDIVKGSIWGVTLAVANHFEDVGQLENLEPNSLVLMKPLNGVPMSETHKTLLPAVEALPSALAMVDRESELFRRVSRKGPTGEKMAPNPSATEFETISKELLKSVNRVIIRLEGMFEELIYGMYVYTVSNRTDKVQLEAQAYRIVGSKDDVMLGKQGAFAQANKGIILDPQDLFIDNLGFRLVVVKDKDKEAVEIQQAMQIMQLIHSTGAIKNPATGQPEVFEDDSGAQTVMNSYGLWTNLFRLFGIPLDTAWKKFETPQEEPGQPGMEMLGEEQAGEQGLPEDSGINAPQAPQEAAPLNQSTETGDILGAAQRIR